MLFLVVYLEDLVEGESPSAGFYGGEPPKLIVKLKDILFVGNAERQVCIGPDGLKEQKRV